MKETTEERIVRMHERPPYRTPAEIARALDLSQNRVSKVLTAHYARRRDERRDHSRLEGEAEEEG